MALAGINEQEMRAIARDLARNVAPLAGNWMLAGSAAMAAVRRRMPHGASNRFLSDPGAFKQGFDPLGLGSLVKEVSRVLDARSANSAIDSILDSWKIDLSNPMKPWDPIRVEMTEATGYLALTKGGGNCQYQAAATFLVLKAAGVKPVDVIWIFTRSGSPKHAACVIGIHDGFRNPCEPEVAGWRPTAVTADTWEHDRSEPASVLAERYSPHEHRFYSFARHA
ncbi:hypothetical protein [Roseomonas harenae]|uniref:hypothetical protein n=1 Tax=Muricoccus harenae TaxID=2692566 RepID=UPI001331671C|nr:hypothetical protein [Roseomonas harenae]